MPDELRERLVRIEEITTHQGTSLSRIEGVLEELVRYMAQNEDNRKNIRRQDKRLDDLEKRFDEQRSWLKSRLWFVTSIAAFLVGAIEILFKIL